MDDDKKSRGQLIEELRELRLQLAPSARASRSAEVPGERSEMGPVPPAWEAIFDAISSAVWMLDPEFRIERSNKAAEEIFHLTADKIIGKHCWEIVHGTSQPIAQCPVMRVIQSQKRESSEMQIGENWFEVVVDVVKDLSGQVIGYVHVVNDITERRRMEALLRKSEATYRIVSEFAYDWEYWLGPNGNFLYISPSCERITGYAPSDFKNEPELLRRIVHPEDRSVFTHHLADFLKNSQRLCLEFQFRIIAKNGTTVWLAHQCHPILSEEGENMGRRVSSRDITDRKRVEEALQTSEKQLRALMEASTESVFLMDVEGHLIAANSKTAERLNTNMDSLGKGGLYDFIPAAVAEGRKRNIQQVIQTGQPLQFEDERFGRTILNSVYPIKDHNGRVTHLAIYGIDISDRKAIEHRLLESEDRYRTIFQNNLAVTLIIDPENGRIVDANAAAQKYYGYDFRQPPGKTIMEINSLTPEQVFEEMARAKAEQRHCFFFSHRLATGEVRPVEVYSGPIVVEGKQLLYSIVHDINERRKAEEERERLIVELRDALSKIRTLSGLLPICSHCKKIRDDQGYWTQIESYIKEHSQVDFSHGICPECMKRIYPEYMG